MSEVNNIKNARPSQFFVSKDLPHVLTLYAEFNYLKHICRKGWMLKGRDISMEKCETVAEHSFGVAVLAMLIAEECFPELDIAKVIKMALIHEIGEIHIGDLTPADGKLYKTKANKEEQFADTVLGSIKHGKEYSEIFREFNMHTSPEGSFVKQIDKLEMGLQASIYEYLENKNLQVFFDDVDKNIKDPKLRGMLNKLITARKSTPSNPEP